MEAALAAVAAWAKARAVDWLARNWRKIVVAGVALVAVVVFLMTMAATLLAGTSQVAAASSACTELGYKVDQAAYEPAPIGAAPAIPSGGAVPGFGPDEGEKVAVAQAIVAAGQAAGVGRRGMIVAIATALQESGLRNLDFGDRDSLGPFQQRPSQGWGTPEQVRDLSFSSRAFFGGPNSPHYNPATGKASPGGLLEVPGWADMPITVAAQRVQRSAFPDAYAKHEARATTIVDGLGGGEGSVPPPASGQGSAGVEGGTPPFTSAADFRNAGVDIDAFCTANFELVASGGVVGLPAGQVIPEGQWTAPLQSRVTSEFGVRTHPVFGDRRMHNGTDFRARTPTPVVAPSVGVVASVKFSSGRGLTVTLTHAGGVQTLHQHLSEALVQPGAQVQGGQVIALTGNTGTGSAPHYHLEVHVNGQPTDPVAWMLGAGVNLRAWS